MLEAQVTTDFASALALGTYQRTIQNHRPTYDLIIYDESWIPGKKTASYVWQKITVCTIFASDKAWLANPIWQTFQVLLMPHVIFSSFNRKSNVTSHFCYRLFPSFFSTGTCICLNLAFMASFGKIHSDLEDQRCRVFVGFSFKRPPTLGFPERVT